jgi:hypothetical protein
MPVAVNVPIRIKVDPDALARRPRCIEDALSKAVGRALKQSQRVVLDARGGYPAIQIHAPEISWGGDGLDRVSQVQRLATSDLVASALDRAVEAAGLLAGGEGPETVAVPLSDDASERLDPDRHAPIVGRYLIPSYDRPGRKVAIKTESKGKPSTGTTAAAAANAPVLDFVMAQQSWDYWDYLFALYDVAQFYAIRADGNDEHPRLPMTSPGVLGLLFAHYTGGYEFVFYDVPDPGRVLIEGGDHATFSLLQIEWTFETPHRIEVSADTGTLQVRQVDVPVPLSDSYTLTFVSAATEKERRAFREQRIRNKLPEQVKAERHKLHPVLTDAEFADLVERLVAEQVAGIKDDPTVKGFAILDPGGVIPVEEWPAALGSGPILMLPRTHELTQEEIQQRAKAAAGARGRAKGVTGTAGADAAARARSAGTAPVGPKGLEGKPSPHPGDPNAPDVDCWKDFSTRYSASHPGDYLEDSDHLKCRPLLGEPALDQLGDHAKPLQARIQRLIAELGLATCGIYAGSFCLGAGQAIASRARQLGDEAATSTGTAGVVKATHDGNLGFVQFDPQSTPAIQELHRLAGLLDDVMELADKMKSLYDWWWPNLCGRWYEQSSQWGLAFETLFHPIKNEAVGNLFKVTCRILLLQLLESSRSQLDARMQNLPTYAPVFEFLFRAYFTEKTDLEKLKARLQLRTQFQAAAVSPAGSWKELSGSLLEELDKGNTTQPGTLTVRDDLVYNAEQKIVGIQDEHGNVWTKASLEQALSQREYLVESIDPMIKQFSNDEATFILGMLNNNPTFAVRLPKGDIEKAILVRVIGADKISTKIVVEAILREMLKNNESQARKTRQSFDYAFDNAPLHENTKASHIPYCSFALQGLHKLADEQIGDAFRLHPEHYGWELNDVLSARAGAESLTSFFQMVGVVLLSIVCPPLGVAAGAAMAVRDYATALEKKELFRSLIDPDLVITRAEVEAGLFAAELGLALAFLPHAKSVLGGAVRGIEIVSEQGVRNSAKAIVTQARRALTREAAQAAAAAIRQRFARQVAEAIKDDFAVALSKELVQGELMNVFMGTLLIDPIVDQISKEFEDYSSGAHGPGLVTLTFGQGSP